MILMYADSGSPPRRGGRGEAKPVKEKKRTARRKVPEQLDSTNSLLVHDIKNLSFRLGSLLQNLENNYEDPLFKKSVLEILTDTVDRMDQIIHRCRGRQGDLIIKYPIDLNEILNEIVNLLPRPAKKRFFIRESYENIPTIWGDPEYLKEAFSILTDNALQAMEQDGGQLQLSTSFLVTRSGRKKVIVKISDTGCGMSKEFIKTRLYAPFVSTKENGLGLGLYACRKIIALHEGTIRTTSREGQGTTFRIDFPTAT